MRMIGHTTIYTKRFIVDLNPDCLQTLCFSICSREGTIWYKLLVAIGLYMRCIIDQSRLITLRCGPTVLYIGNCTGSCWWCHALRYNVDLDCLQTLCESGSTCSLSVLCPAKPAKGLCMYTIIYVKLVCIIACQLDSDCLQTFGLSCCSA